MAGSATDLRGAMGVVSRHGLMPLVAETHAVRDIASAYGSLRQSFRSPISLSRQCLAEAKQQERHIG